MKKRILKEDMNSLSINLMKQNYSFVIMSLILLSVYLILSPGVAGSLKKFRAFNVSVWPLPEQNPCHIKSSHIRSH